MVRDILNLRKFKALCLLECDSQHKTVDGIEFYPNIGRPTYLATVPKILPEGKLKTFSFLFRLLYFVDSESNDVLSYNIFN